MGVMNFGTGGDGSETGVAVVATPGRLVALALLGRRFGIKAERGPF